VIDPDRVEGLRQLFARLAEVVNRVNDSRRGYGVLLFQVDHLVEVQNAEQGGRVEQRDVESGSQYTHLS
jgi:hypothetical protein